MTKLNWHLIFGLSSFGLAMAVGTIAVVPSNVEPIVCLAIFVVCAFVIARTCSDRHFLHGLLVGMREQRLGHESAHRFLRQLPRPSSEGSGDDGLDAAAELAAADDGTRRASGGGGYGGEVIIGLLAFLVGRFVRLRP